MAAAGRAAGGSGTETKAPSGCSPSRRTERKKRSDGRTVRGTKRQTGEIDEGIGFRETHQRLNSQCS